MKAEEEETDAGEASRLNLAAPSSAASSGVKLTSISSNTNTWGGVLKIHIHAVNVNLVQDKNLGCTCTIT